METVAADAVVFVVFVRNCVHEGLAGHSLMEGGVEYADHGNVAHDLTAGIDAGDVCGVVQGSEGSAFLEGCHDLVGDKHGGSELLAAVNDTVTDSVDLLHGGHDTVFLAGELLDDSSYCLGMGGKGDILVEYGLIADEGAVLEMTVDADTLAETLCHYLFGLHVDELILEGGAACVDNKNLHYKIPFLL